MVKPMHVNDTARWVGGDTPLKEHFWSRLAGLPVFYSVWRAKRGENLAVHSIIRSDATLCFLELFVARAENGVGPRFLE
jgi:hypothetical protein